MRAASSVGKWPLVFTAFRSCRFERLDRVGRVDHAAGLGLKREKRDHVLPAVSPCLGTDLRLYRHFKVDSCHAAPLKFYPEPPHQIVGLNLPPS